jgi:integrase
MIRKRTTKKGDLRYDFRGRLPSGKVHNRTFRTKALAREYEARFIAQRAQGMGLLDAELAKMSFGAWADRVSSAEVEWKRLKTRSRDASVLRRHLRPALGDLRLNAIRQHDVQGLVNHWVRCGLQPSTIRTYYAVLRAIMQVAVDSGAIARNPADRVKLPRLKRRDPGVLSPNEILAIADQVGPRWRALILVMAELGLRWGEAIGLRVMDVDPLRRSVSVLQNVAEAGGAIEIGPPKTPAGVRTIAASQQLVAELSLHMAQRSLTAVDADQLLFCAESGAPLRYSNFRTRVWNPALKAAGITPGGFHRLRHSAATLWIANGVDPRTAQHRLGHETPNLTLKIYTHLSDEADRRAAVATADAFWPTPHSPSLEVRDVNGR